MGSYWMRHCVYLYTWVQDLVDCGVAVRLTGLYEVGDILTLESILRRCFSASNYGGANPKRNKWGVHSNCHCSVKIQKQRYTIGIWFDRYRARPKSRRRYGIRLRILNAKMEVIVLYIVLYYIALLEQWGRNCEWDGEIHRVVVGGWNLRSSNKPDNYNRKFSHVT